ncbi:carboxylate-amine ligase [Actinoplanes octamycinicus]|uniref:Putative glutamate--cysteine ligase 2 n=1 Tax=Actinoplanes octamycinicus TaxID=135948 RepID=A0A7W7MAJ8_9ACTN|nr:glutamate--cysteine ligase [Actinoplanes octamycinicus]MBB4742905.1 carboxylate-amine ligase [Actinoplanes octamycinicus]GIE58242.1 putative glutamate--cysteine ligase 2 [Actinoplanes octamycinicus]
MMSHSPRPLMAGRSAVPEPTAVTFGVEEEFLLLDPHSGRPVPAGPALLHRLREQPGPRAELMRYQVETTTAVCRGADELRREISRLRTLAAAGARSLGCALVASGMAPYGAPGLSALSDSPRYRGLALRYPALTAQFGCCSCHVHVGVATRDLGVQVLARLRPWLATLLAISANSPIADGHDTGWASHRYSVVAQWPTGRPPGEWQDAAEYDRVIQQLLRRGAAMDERSVYLLARLSPRYPTVEVRVADSCADADTTVLIAILVRALVAAAVTEIRAGLALTPVPSPRLVAGLLAAARNGLTGAGVDPMSGRTVPAWDLVAGLVDHVRGTLADLGDAETVTGLLEQLRRRGTGAHRQRILWTGTTSAAEVVAGLAAVTAAPPTTPARRPASGHRSHAGSGSLRS